MNFAERAELLSWVSLFCLVCFGCAHPLPRVDAPSAAERRVHQWQETLAVLERYLATADWRDRMRVADAEGEDEILASRIFRAFDVYVRMKPGFLVSGEAEGGAGRCLKEARPELLRNPHLSLLWLRPVVDEVPPDVRDGLGDYVLSRTGLQYCEHYLCLCTEIGMVEEDGKAREVLRELTGHSNEMVRKSAQGALLYLEEVNIFNVGRRYRESQASEDLHWVSDYYLREGLPRPKVERHLGPGRMVNSYTVLYEGKRTGRGRPGPGALRLEYHDGRLNVWEWM
jgi:hypothetical protein